MARVDVLLERSTKRTFAIALDWPGWARAGRDDDDAVATLEAYRGRYAGVLDDEGLATPDGTVRVAGAVEGDATTAFGAPGQVVEADRRALRAATRATQAAILRACWARLDACTATRARLRTGPRGGGRDVEAIRRHVADAEVAYARGLGLSVRATNGDPAKVDELRARLCALVEGTVPPDREGRWPLRYGVRRVAWHALDHAFEIEDRRSVP